MAPTKDIIITIPTLEGMVAALMVFHRTIIDLLFDYNILLGCTLIFLSFYPTHVASKSKCPLSSARVGDLFKTNPSPNIEQGEGTEPAPRYQSYGAIKPPESVESGGNHKIKEEEMARCVWRVFSWILLIGGIFVMIPTE